MYKSGRATNTVSQKSSEESVTNAVPALRPIVEEESFFNTSSSMASKNHVSASIPDTHPMLFNVRLVFARTNTFDAQLFTDPMKHWVVKIAKRPRAFDASPWVNYQGKMYICQEGVRYQVVTKPNRVNKWGHMVTNQKYEEPPYE